MKTGIALLVIAFSSFAWGDFYTATRPFTIVSRNDISGFRVIAQLPGRHPMRKLGVKKGDIVIAVNFNPIYDRATAKAAYDGKSIESVTVIRNKHQILLKRPS